MLLQKSCFQLLLQDIDISQGSVATYLMCGRIFTDNLITNFRLILTVKKLATLRSRENNMYSRPILHYMRFTLPMYSRFSLNIPGFIFSACNETHATAYSVSRDVQRIGLPISMSWCQ